MTGKPPGKLPKHVKAGRILTALAIVWGPLTGTPGAGDDLPLLAHAFDDKPKLPPMPGSLPYLWQQFRRWLKTVSGSQKSN